MCTAISFKQKDHYFGRNLDLDRGNAEQITITPRNYPFSFRNGLVKKTHYAMIGMATIAQEYPLYYEATNEKGLSMAGLNFPGEARYQVRIAGKDNIAPFELIPWVLGQCESVNEAMQLLQKTSVWMLPFSREYLLTPLHWMICDREHCMVAEPVADGLKLYDNPAHVLTNSPCFPYHMHRLSDFSRLDPFSSCSGFCSIPVQSYSAGQGAIGLPGDFSSVSRFVRAAFVRANSSICTENTETASHFFHLLNAVAMPKGSILMENGNPEITLYSCCCNTDKGIYYYNTYANSRISAVHLQHCNLEDRHLTTFPLRNFPEVFHQN